MTKQDDANLNTDNPLSLRAEENGNVTGNLNYTEVDSNFLNLMRWAGKWTARKHIVNEVVNHRGGVWMVLNDTTTEPYTGADWLEISSPMGRASMSINAPNVRPDIGVAWQTLDNFDQVDLTAVGSTVTLATGEFTFNYPGLWMLNVGLSFEHDSSNNGRTLELRAYNVSEATGSTPYRVGIGRNVTDTAVAITVMVPVVDTSIGDTFRLEYSSASAVSSVVFNTQALDLTQLHPA